MYILFSFFFLFFILDQRTDNSKVSYTGNDKNTTTTNLLIIYQSTLMHTYTYTHTSTHAPMQANKLYIFFFIIDFLLSLLFSPDFSFALIQCFRHFNLNIVSEMIISSSYKFPHLQCLFISYSQIVFRCRIDQRNILI